MNLFLFCVVSERHRRKKSWNLIVNWPWSGILINTKETTRKKQRKCSSISLQRKKSSQILVSKIASFVSLFFPSFVRTVRPLFIRSAPSFVWSVGRSVVCPYGRSVPSFLRSVCSLFVWSVDRNLRFGRSFGCYLVCSFSQQKVLWLYSFVCSFGSVFSFSFLRTVVDPSLFVFDRPCSRSSGG